MKGDRAACHLSQSSTSPIHLPLCIFSLDNGGRRFGGGKRIELSLLLVLLADFLMPSMFVFFVIPLSSVSHPEKCLEVLGLVSTGVVKL